MKVSALVSLVLLLLLLLLLPYVCLFIDMHATMLLFLFFRSFIASHMFRSLTSACVMYTQLPNALRVSVCVCVRVCIGACIALSSVAAVVLCSVANLMCYWNQFDSVSFSFAFVPLFFLCVESSVWARLCFVERLLLRWNENWLLLSRHNT